MPLPGYTTNIVEIVLHLHFAFQAAAVGTPPHASAPQWATSLVYMCDHLAPGPLHYGWVSDFHQIVEIETGQSNNLDIPRLDSQGYKETSESIGTNPKFPQYVLL